MTIGENTVSLAEKLKKEMLLSDDKAIITINEQGIVEALKEDGLDLATVDKVHEATKKIFNATMLAAGEIVADNVIGDETIDEGHMTIFHMNQFQQDSFAHSFTNLGDGNVEFHSVYEQELQGTDYKAISDHLKERFKVVL